MVSSFVQDSRLIEKACLCLDVLIFALKEQEHDSTCAMGNSERSQHRFLRFRQFSKQIMNKFLLWSVLLHHSLFLEPVDRRFHSFCERNIGSETEFLFRFLNTEIKIQTEKLDASVRENRSFLLLQQFP